jgi:hypothetical protein
MIYNKNKNSLETAFLGKKFPWSGIPCCGVPWKKFSLLWHSLKRHSLEKKFLGVSYSHKIAVKISKIANYFQTKNKFDENSTWCTFKYQNKQIQVKKFEPLSKIE